MGLDDAGTQSKATLLGKAAYWKIAGGEVMMHSSDGTNLNFREVSDMAKFLGVTCCDDWEVVED